MQTLYRGMVENIAIHLRENKWSETKAIVNDTEKKIPQEEK